MNLRATLGLDTAGFTGPLAGARAALGGFRSGLGGLIGPLAGITGGLLSVAAAARLVKGAIDKAAEMETLTGSFTTLLGSAGAARQRMKELADFAASTPFELPEIAAASRLLQAFTGAALSTGRGLTLVGDSAAAVSQPLEAVTMWMGRLYAALREGQQLGEPLQNLTQLGLISGEVRRQLLAVQGQAQSEARTMEILTVAFGRNQGAMERLSQTYAGKLSTMRDGWAALQRAFAEPLIDALKPMLDRGTEQMAQMEGRAQRLGDTVAAYLEAFAGGELGELLGISLLRAVARFAAELAQTMLVDVPGMFVAGLMAPIRYVVGQFRSLMAAALLELAEQANKVLPERYEIETKGLRAAAGQAEDFSTVLAQEMAKRMRGNTNWADVVDAPLQGIADRILQPFRDAVAKAREMREGTAAPDTASTAKSPAAGTGKLADIATDRFAKVGLFVGGAGGPAVDYARRTASATEKLVNIVAKGVPGGAAAYGLSGGAYRWGL